GRCRSRYSTYFLQHLIKTVVSCRAGNHYRLDPESRSPARVGQSAVMQKHRSSEMVASALRSTSAPELGVGNQRQRIIDAMIDSSAEKTYAATTITDLVARARISRTTFYKQFDDKRACFDAAIGHCIEQLQEVAASAHSEEDPPAD